MLFKIVLMTVLLAYTVCLIPVVMDKINHLVRAITSSEINR